MLELIAIVAGVIVCVMLPIELGKVRKGWVHRKFAGDRPKFLAAYRRQLRVMMWMGLVLGVAGIGLAAVADQRAETIVKLIASVVWLVVAGVAWNSHRALAQMPDAEPVASSGAG